jgi:hypothetical protein
VGRVQFGPSELRAGVGRRLRYGGLVIDDLEERVARARSRGVSERYVIIAAQSEWWGEYRLREGLCWWCGGAVPPCCPSRGSAIPHAALAHLTRR